MPPQSTPGAACRRWSRALPAAGLLFLAGGSAAHPLSPRLNLAGFSRRADVILRGRVLRATRPRDPHGGRYPHLTRVRVEKIYRGRGVGAEVEVLGRDDHALTYRAGERAVFFLQGSPRSGAALVADQNHGERLPVRPGEEAAWDAALTAIVGAVRKHGDPWADPGYRRALLAALSASPRALRRRALRAVLGHLGPDAVAEREAVLRAFARRSLPDGERIALLGAVLRWLPPARLEALAMDATEHPGVRGRILEAWAQRLARKGSSAQRRRAGDRLASLLSSSPRLVALHAAAALARLSDPRGRDLLREILRRGTPRDRRGAIRGLRMLARTGDRAAWEALVAARGRVRDRRVAGWIAAALRGLKPPPVAARATGAWIAVAAGVGLLALGVGLWFRRRRRPSAPGPANP